MRVLILSLFLIYLEGQAEIIPKKQLPPLKEDEEYETIFIKEGDTLWDIANRYYNNPQKWREFELYNIFTDPNLIYPGERLTLKFKVIPKPEGIKGAIPASLGTPAEEIVKLKKEIEERERELKEAKEKEETLRAAYTNLNLSYGTLSLYSKKLEEELNLIKRQIREREEAERKNQERIKSLEKKNKMLKATIGLTALAALSLLLIFR
jgi:DNA repair exonuclease SbcCD ATPase subunit